MSKKDAEKRIVYNVKITFSNLRPLYLLERKGRRLPALDFRHWHSFPVDATYRDRLE